MVLQVRLFGGVDATAAGRTIDLGPAKRRAVLAALALSAGTAVPLSRIVELVWGAAPPRTADKTLQAHIARLRSVLGHDTIARVGAAYRLDLPADAIDVLRFQHRLGAGDVEGALAEWTGPPLAGLDADGLRATIDGLVEQRLAAIGTRMGQLVDTDPPAAVGPLTELTTAHPFREELWALLMTALYRVGRQADALAAYQTVRSRLRDDLGVEPGARLRDLEAAILAHDDRLLSTRHRVLPGAPGPPGVERGNLPARRPHLVGRANELAVILDALATTPLVTLVGPGGIGKTQLALAAAHAVADDRRDPVWLVELAPVASAADVSRVVADTLGIIERPGHTVVAAIVTALRDRRALLVLDNCEHVIEAVAAVVAAVVADCPDIQVLATSRERLGVDREQVVVVPPLAPGSGAELFATRAAGAGPDAGPLVSGVAEQISRRLDGVPLAIELAAARTSALAPGDLLARLDDALRLLTDDRRDDLAHHRTLRATIRWSYDLLTPAERSVLQRLSVFAGPFDLAAAEAVATGGGLDTVEVDVLVGRLVDRSMVLVDAGPHGRSFRLLDTVRRFAADRLADDGHADVLADRHARWCADAVARIGQLLAGPDEVVGVASLRQLLPNVRAAVDHACTTADHGLGYALLRPIVGEIILRSHIEIGDWVERVLQSTPADAEESVAVGLGWAAQRYAITSDPHGFERLAARHGPPDHVLVRHARAFARSDYPSLAELAPQAVAALHRQGQHHLAELTEPDRGVALINLGRLDEADAHIAPLTDRYRAQGPPTLLNWTLMLRGYIAAFSGDVEGSEQLFEAAVAVPIPPRTHTPNRPIQARIAWRQGQRGHAVALLRGHADELLSTGNMQGASLVALELVTILTALDRRRDAARTLGYLQATHLLDAPGFAALVADATAALTDDPALADELAAGRALDDRGALSQMRDLLAEVADARTDGPDGQVSR